MPLIGAVGTFADEDAVPSDILGFLTHRVVLMDQFAFGQPQEQFILAEHT
jgi:hypothetical protein